MGMLDRYKKKGGFAQLLQLLETSGATKREQFLGLIANENPIWEAELRKKILTIQRVYSWDASYLSEVLTRVPQLTLASALKGSPPEEIDKILSCLPPISKRKITDLVDETNVNPAEKATSISKILSEVRGFVAQGILRLDKVDPELAIAENIEELLANSNSNSVGLVFPDDNQPSKNSTNRTETSSGGNNDLQHEIEFLRRKQNQHLAEINALKQEVSVLKDKLAQIKRIA